MDGHKKKSQPVWIGSFLKISATFYMLDPNYAALFVALAFLIHQSEDLKDSGFYISS